MTEETREIIRWLNSTEGLRWSHARHKQTRHAVRLFSVKHEAGGHVSDQIWVDWGKVDSQGLYHDPLPPQEMPVNGTSLDDMAHAMTAFYEAVLPDRS